MPRVPHRLSAAALAAACAAALAGCGSGGSANARDGRPTTIAMSEFRLAPQDLRVGAGRQALVIRNAGTMVHRFEIRRTRADGGRRLFRGEPLRPGASQRVTLRLPRGEYVMRCGQPRHYTLGEHGTLRVG